MNFLELERNILHNRGNTEFLSNVIQEMILFRNKLDWQMKKFLTDFCKGVNGLDKTQLNSSEPIYRYYNYKCEQYSNTERMIRVATAYKKA